MGGVESSSLSRPTILNWGISSAGRAPDLHSGGQRFDPAILHQKHLVIKIVNKNNLYQYLYPIVRIDEQSRMFKLLNIQIKI